MTFHAPKLITLTALLLSAAVFPLSAAADTTQTPQSSLSQSACPKPFKTRVMNLSKVFMCSPSPIWPPLINYSIQIEYQDSTDIKDGKASVVFPMTVAPRYSPPSTLIQLASADGAPVTAVLDPVLDRKRITPPLMNPKDEPTEYIRLPVSIEVTLEAGFDINNIKSAYHTVNRLSRDPW